MHQWLATGRFFFSGSFGFLHQWNWLPWYNWNIVESGIRHHQTNKKLPVYFLNIIFDVDILKVLINLRKKSMSHRMCNNVLNYRSQLPNMGFNNTDVKIILKIFIVFLRYFVSFSIKIWKYNREILIESWLFLFMIKSYSPLTIKLKIAQWFYC